MGISFLLIFINGSWFEQGGVRPVLIIQNNIGNKFSPTVIIIAAITSKISKPKMPTHIGLVAKEVGLEKIQ